MSFNTALSGLNSASADLNVKSNNIANVNTVGFKGSRAEFADIFAVSAFGSSDTAVGNGAVLKNVAQQFKQGNLQFTDNSLDLSISGQGFFALSPNQTSQELVYTRAGAFNVNKDGYLVNSSDQFLRVFEVNADATISSTSLASAKPVQLPESAGDPQKTANVTMVLNLPSTAPAIAANTAIQPDDPKTYSRATSATIFDSLGNEHRISLYFQKSNTANQWAVEAYIPSADITGSSGSFTKVGATRLLEFDPAQSGNLKPAAAASGGNPAIDTDLDFTIAAGKFVSGADAQTVKINFADSTQNSGAFAVTTLAQDGFPTGRLSGLDIGDDGLMRATFTNGQAEPIGKIAIANFSNPQGLKQIGNTSWTETLDSGQAIGGEAGTGVLGLIQSGALEASNVDLTAELVGLITAQRNFQANSKAIETNNAITQTIINLR